jgi:HTH-type transcriptional regulator / antitoxin HigA
MAERTYRYEPDVVSPPGETLEEMLEDRHMTQKDLAQRMGRPLKTINEIIKGKAAITADTALQLERVLGAPASFWSQREAHYREYCSRVAEQERLAGFQDWVERLPLSWMRRHCGLSRTRDRTNSVKEALDFFGIASPAQWETVYAEPQAAFRCNRPGPVVATKLSPWIRKGELEAGRIVCAPFDADRFKEVLKQIRGLTREPPTVFQPKLERLCASAGVVVAFVPAVPGTDISGLTRWLSPTKALIQLSLFGKFNDRLWFTFFHEAGHILLHRKKLVFLEGAKGNGPMEQEADRFAANLLIPPRNHDELQLLPRSEKAIRVFADRIGIHPGIVVGRMQHEDLLPQSHLNKLKDRFELVEG